MLTGPYVLRDPKKNSSMKVPIGYWILNGEDLTIEDGPTIKKKNDV